MDRRSREESRDGLDLIGEKGGLSDLRAAPVDHFDVPTPVTLADEAGHLGGREARAGTVEHTGHAAGNLPGL